MRMLGAGRVLLNPDEAAEYRRDPDAVMRKAKALQAMAEAMVVFRREAASIFKFRRRGILMLTPNERLIAEGLKIGVAEYRRIRLNMLRQAKANAQSRSRAALVYGKWRWRKAA